MTLLFTSLIVALHSPALSGGSDSWPAWRGANGSGVAEGSPPVEWSEEKNVRWKTPIPGKGLSSPVVWGTRVFLTTSIGTGKKAEGAPAEAGSGERGRPDGEGGERPRGERPDGPRDGGGRGRGGPGRGGLLEEQDFAVLALDRASGTVLWQKKVATQMPHQGTHPDGSYASPTVATDGEIVVASFGSNGLYALDMAGAVVWTVDLGDMQITGSFGEGSSPILHGDLVVLSWDHDGDSFLVALDRKTGQERWRTPRPRGTSWTTPIVVRAGGAEQIVVGGTRTAAYDPATGRELWHQGEAAGGRSGPIASPDYS